VIPNIDLSGTPNAQWSDFQNSDPIAAIEAQRSTILLGCTKEPNTLFVSFLVHQQLKQHPIILDRFQKHGATSRLSLRPAISRLFQC